MGDVMYFPSHVAIILGIQQREIWSWIKSGELKTVFQNGKTYILHKDIIDYLNRYPENVGRVYCDDLIPFFNDARADIIVRLEVLREIFENVHNWR